MNTFLDSQNLIPLTQPYKNAPWNYNGSESVSSIPSNIVDWVLVELRTSTTATSSVAEKAAFIKGDGTIVDLDGTSPLTFSSLPSASYYIVIKHRNHLSIMSAQPIPLSQNPVAYDFTTDQTKAYGTNPMADLGNGHFGMYSGDGDANGGVSSTDRNNIWRIQNGNIGYLPGDYDLSGGANSADLNSCWRPSNGVSTQVPQ